AGSSYLSHNSLWLTFGLGASAAVDTLEIRWPSGLIDQYTRVAGDRFVVVEEGRGIDAVEH
ncbi:MAG: ASPIC/UnbV domain-containing protein, partial [Gemmatimonadota bacterium]|nr:ASPIC/UnbV domain-containing protein [Gemmatimonadota bacterium]